MKPFCLLLLFTLLVAPGCDLRKREDALTEKEVMLNQKEQELLLKEKTLQLKEEEILKKQQSLDSTRQFDSGAYNAALPGAWEVRMTCTETSCPGSAVGDTKNETWEISYQDNNVIARAMVNNELVRTYSGIFTGNTLELVETRDNITTQPATRMVVRLRFSSEKQMEGQREIERIGQCKIIYETVMTKK